MDIPICVLVHTHMCVGPYHLLQKLNALWVSSLCSSWVPNERQAKRIDGLDVSSTALSWKIISAGFQISSSEVSTAPRQSRLPGLPKLPFLSLNVLTTLTRPFLFECSRCTRPSLSAAFWRLGCDSGSTLFALNACGSKCF